MNSSFFSKFALIFPGQGSQEPQMGQLLYQNFKQAKLVFDQASEALEFDMTELCFSAPKQTLNMTYNTQPAILTVSIAALRVFQSELIYTPTWVAGHSVGEFGALVAADVLSFSEAIKAVRLRGTLMQEAVPAGEGGMAAIMGLNPEQAQWLCDVINKQLGHEALSCANFNSPGQIVVSGFQKAIESLSSFDPKPYINDSNLPYINSELWPKYKVIPLAVSAPFHCNMMLPAQNKMAEYLDGLNFSDAKIPIIQNIDAKAHTHGQTIKQNLIEQIYKPVLWMQSIQNLTNQGLSGAIEIGHGKVLSGLFKKINPNARVFNLSHPSDLNIIKELS